MARRVGANWSVVGALSVILLIGSGTETASGDPTHLLIEDMSVAHEDRRVWAVSDHFRVNPSETKRLVIPNTCEEQGERDLGTLAASAELEESFAFIPDLCLWIETGYGETRTTVRLDTAFVERLLKVHPTIILYHTHVGTPRDVTEIFPAYADLIGLILLNGRYLKSPQINISHRAVTSRGTIDYSFVLSQETERLLSRLEQTGLGNFVAQNLAYEFARESHRLTYYEAVGECASRVIDPDRRIEDCFPMRADDFLLQYRTGAAQAATSRLD